MVTIDHFPSINSLTPYKLTGFLKRTNRQYISKGFLIANDAIAERK
jgi:hypothetical protein